MTTYLTAWSQTMHRTAWRDWVTATIASAALFFIGGLLTMLPAFQGKLVNLFWPPAAFAFAAFWWFGPRAAPGVALGSLLTSLFVFAIPQPGQILATLIGNALQMLLATWWLRRQGVHDIFADEQSFLHFILVAVLLAPCIGASIGAGSLWLHGLTPSLPTTWLAWWSGDNLGMMLMAPSLLALPRLIQSRLAPARLAELAVVSALLLWPGYLLFSAPAQAKPPITLFAVIPLGVWLVARFPVNVLAPLLGIFSFLAIRSTADGQGPFARDTAQDSAMMLYLFLWTLNGTVLLIGIAIAHSRRNLARLEEQQQLFDTLSRLTPGMIYQYRQTPDGRVSLPYVSEAIQEIYGLTPAQVRDDASAVLARIHPEDLAMVDRTMREALAAMRPWDGIFRVNLPDKGLRWVSGQARPEKLADGGITWHGFTQDVTDRQTAALESRIAAIAFESQEGIVITDARLGILRTNQAFSRITGYAAAEVIGQTTKIFRSSQQGEATYEGLYEGLRQQGGWQGELLMKRKNGEPFPVDLSITAVRNEAGDVSHYVATFSDITAAKSAASEIAQLAFYDALTGLPNRRLLIDRLKQALVAGVRNGRRGALLFIDLDRFKGLNDTLGHAAGDRLLQQVAGHLSACVREGDTVARLGGDEFVVLLEDLSPQVHEAAVQAEIVGHKILATLDKSYRLFSHSHRSSGSVGIALFGQELLSYEELLKQADIAMYQAKQDGRNTLRFFDPQMQQDIDNRTALEHALRQAIDNHEFQLHYQVQTDSAGLAVGAEALIRWHHPQRGMVSPGEFIPLAEESGLILPLGQWVLETACAQLAAWQQSPVTRHLVLAVNVSAKQFRQADFVTRLQAAIERHAVTPRLLKIEITEGMLLENMEETIARMQALKAIGVQFSLDDFGTGYSSLQYLKRLPLDQIKIDQSFVRDIAENDNDRAIVRTIIAMAKSLKLGIIAEGVETDTQWTFLLDNGCYHFQGYLFGKPMPATDFETLLESRRHTTT